MDNIVLWEEKAEKEFYFENQEILIGNSNTEYIFSLIIAVYNSDKYLRETLESIINQNFDFSKIQIILVDDGSTDNSYKICMNYALKYPDNIIFIHKENGGVSSARNAGLWYATGKYINFIDSDDKFSSNVCSEIYKFFESNQQITDAVTIRVQIFGDKTGESWFNKKFENGNRVINLFKEPTVYLNSVNCTFFHRRIKNQLHFDEGLCIAEDLKVVNTVLMNKYTLGVVATCSYFYRIRSKESLVSTARNKENWYFAYLNKVFFWLYNKSVAQTGHFLEFLQYTLLRELYNRLNDNKECVDVLRDDRTIARYKSTLFHALSLIEDKIILKCGFLNSDFLLYIFSQRYGKPAIYIKNNEVHFNWKSGVDIAKKLYVNYEICSVERDNLILEGYIIVNNIQYNESEYKVMAEYVNKNIEIYPLRNTSNDMLAFADEYILYRKYFKFSLPLPEHKSQLKFFLLINGVKVPYQIYGYGQWFGVDSSIAGCYYYNNHFLLTIENSILQIEKASRWKAVKCEFLLWRTLYKNGKTDSTSRKSLMLRLYFWVKRVFKFREIWIVSDRCISAGDNGEAFYDFLKKKKSIDSYFAISSDAEDYARLKQKKVKLLAINSRRYKKKCLLADKLVSAHFDHAELYPVSTPHLNDIMTKKMHIFLQHGITKDDLTRFYSRKRQKIDLFVTSTESEYKSIVENNNYFCDASIVKLTGFPRYDKLYSSSQKTILVMPTWRNNLVSFGPDSKNACVSDRFVESEYYNFVQSLFSNRRLKEKIAESGYHILYFPHSNMISTNRFFENIPNVEIVEGADRDYNKIFAKSAVMITDYSSTAFDFVYLRKPVIYWQGDQVEFFKTHTYTKGYFDYKRDGFGPVTNTVEETVNELIRLLDNNCKMEEQYLQRVNRFFKFNDKENSLRVYQEIRGKKK